MVKGKLSMFFTQFQILKRVKNEAKSIERRQRKVKKDNNFYKMNFD